MSAGYEVVELGRGEIDRVAHLFKQRAGFRPYYRELLGEV